MALPECALDCGSLAIVLSTLSARTWPRSHHQAVLPSNSEPQSLCSSRVNSVFLLVRHSARLEVLLLSVWFKQVTLFNGPRSEIFLSPGLWPFLSLVSCLQAWCLSWSTLPCSSAKMQIIIYQKKFSKNVHFFISLSFVHLLWISLCCAFLTLSIYK